MTKILGYCKCVNKEGHPITGNCLREVVNEKVMEYSKSNFGQIICYYCQEHNLNALREIKIMRNAGKEVLMDNEKKEMEESLEETSREGYQEKTDPDWITNPEEKLLDNKEDYELEMFLSTDGKHTVHVIVKNPNARRTAVKKAMEMYDYIEARYGTKQAQSVREYAKEANGKTISQENCQHTQMKFAESKTEKNPGRWFKSCISCGKFLGWQS